MKSTQILLSSLLGVLSVVTPSVATQYSQASNIDSTEPASSKPVPTTVTWIASEQAEDGTMTLDHFVVVVMDDTDAELAALTVTDTSQRSITLTKTNVPDLKVYSAYTVRVDEYYTDDTSSEGFDGTFYTRPPKLKKVRVTDKTFEDDGDMTVTVKWRQPVNLRDSYIYYDYKVVYPNDNSRLVADDYNWGSDVNSATIADLPARSLKVKVRARDDQYGTGQWSAWKKFNAPAAE
ncbi:MAG: hypothetical protein HY565_04420 [Candidatus Kerfeldbacteria bacterium]|nr:hypothetical protein [Candidatus Kerfeldbacteria bacterium]